MPLGSESLQLEMSRRAGGRHCASWLQSLASLVVSARVNTQHEEERRAFKKFEREKKSQHVIRNCVMRCVCFSSAQASAARREAERLRTSIDDTTVFGARALCYTWAANSVSPRAHAAASEPPIFSAALFISSLVNIANPYRLPHLPFWTWTCILFCIRKSFFPHG
ncbi:hypothetical protein HDK77DRAFT_100779 [Phyllosticta capitalensis]